MTACAESVAEMKAGMQRRGREVRTFLNPCVSGRNGQYRNRIGKSTVRASMRETFETDL